MGNNSAFDRLRELARQEAGILAAKVEYLQCVAEAKSVQQALEWLSSVRGRHKTYEMELLAESLSQELTALTPAREETRSLLVENAARNLNCGGGHCTESTGEVRRLPWNANDPHDGADILCRSCYEHEIAFRRERNASLAEGLRFALPAWDDLEVHIEST